jgi:hypothetical protein
MEFSLGTVWNAWKSLLFVPPKIWEYPISIIVDFVEIGVVEKN